MIPSVLQSQTRTPVRRKNKNDDFNSAMVKLAKSITSDTHDDEWDFYGGMIATKIGKLKSNLARLQAQQEIDQVLFRKQAKDFGFTVVAGISNASGDGTSIA